MSTAPDVFSSLVVPVPARVPWYLRPALWLTRRITGKDPLPARLLTWFPKGAFGVGVFEVTAAGPKDLDGRVLAVARIVSSLVCGCPFCLDMNAATWQRAGLKEEELQKLFDGQVNLSSLGVRESVAAQYAKALSMTPVEISAELTEALRAAFAPREVVVLATTIAQVNYWSRFNQGLGVPSAGFFDESVCRLPASTRD